MLLGLALAPAGANAEKVDNPSPPNFRTEITGGFLQFIGTAGTPLQLPFDFAEYDPPLPNPAIIGTVTTNSNGYGVINAPNVSFANCALSNTAGVCFPPIPVNVDDIALTVKILPVSAVTGLIDPLSGRVDLNLSVRLKAEGAALGFDLGNNCYIGSAGNPVVLNTTTHVGSFPNVTPPPAQNIAVADFVSDGSGYAGGWLAAEPYSDEPGEWASGAKIVPGFPIGGTKPTPAQIPLDPLTDFIPRAEGSWRGVNETVAAPAATDCGGSIVTGQVNDLIGLPSAVGASTASFDFKFAQYSGRIPPNHIVNKAVKSKFVASGISSEPWPSTQVPTAVSSQSVSIDASTSYFKIGGNASERYQFDLGTGSFGAWTTNPVANFNAPFIASGGNPITLPIRVRVKDTSGDTDITTRRLRVVPATDITLDTTVSSVAGAGKFRGGSAAHVNFAVTNSSDTDNSSQSIAFDASLPAGVSLTNLDSPAAWTCNTTASSIACTIPQGALGPDEIDIFDATVDVATNAANPSNIDASAVMNGDPDSSNNIEDLDVPVVKTDLTVDVSRTDPLVANGWFPYSVAVSNVGDGLTVGGSSVDVDLPSDFTYRAQGSGGTGWTCVPADPQNITCDTHRGDRRQQCRPGHHDLGPRGPQHARPRIAPSPRRFRPRVTSVPSVEPTATVTPAWSRSFRTSPPTPRSPATTSSATRERHLLGHQRIGRSDRRSDHHHFDPARRPHRYRDQRHRMGLLGDRAGDRRDQLLSMRPGLAAAETSAPITATVAVAQAAYPGVTVPVAVDNDDDGFALNDTDTADVQVRRLDVAIQKLAVKPFNVGIEGRYRLNVTNTGDAATVGPITVLDTLPAGLELKGVSGAGWDCSTSTIGGQDVECVFTGTLGAGIQAAPIEIRVDVLDEAAQAGTVINTAYADTERDTRGVPEDAAITANNESTISTTAVAVDLSIESRHQGDFLVGTEDVYSLDIRNVGFFGTDPGESVTVTDDLPDGIVPLVDDIEATRPGWTCVEDAGDVTCTLEAPDALSSAMEPESSVTIDIPVQVTDAAADSSDNVAEVSTARDSNPTLSPNNIATDPTSVKRIDLSLSRLDLDPVRVLVASAKSRSASTTSAAPRRSNRPRWSSRSLRALPTARPVQRRHGWNCSSPGAGTQITCIRSQSIAVRRHRPGTQAPHQRLDLGPGRLGHGAGDLHQHRTGRASGQQHGDPRSDAGDDRSRDHPESQPGCSSGRQAGPDERARREHRQHRDGLVVTGRGSGQRLLHQRLRFRPGLELHVTGNNVVCTTDRVVPAGGAMAPDITIGFDIPSDQAGTRNTNGSVSSNDDPFPGNDSTSMLISIVATADVTVTVDQPSMARVGDNVTATYDVRNIGTDETSGSPGVTLQISMSNGLLPVSAEGANGDWDCDAVAATESTTAKFDCDFTGQLGAGDTSTVNADFEVIPTDETTADTLAIVRTVGDINRSNDFDSASSTAERR